MLATTDISGWDVATATNFYRMFFEANVYNQNLNPWGSQMSSGDTVADMFASTRCPVPSDPDVNASPVGPLCQYAVFTTKDELVTAIGNADWTSSGYGPVETW